MFEDNQHAVPTPKRGRPPKELDLLLLADYRERCRFTMRQIADRLGVSLRTAQRRWAEYKRNGE